MTKYSWTSDKNVHLRVFLKGIETSFIIVFAIIIYELIKNIEKDFFNPTSSQINYVKNFKHIIHILVIFFAEIILVYLLMFIFNTEF